MYILNEKGGEFLYTRDTNITRPERVIINSTNTLTRLNNSNKFDDLDYVKGYYK